MRSRRLEALLSGDIQAAQPLGYGQELSSKAAQIRRLIQTMVPRHCDEEDAALDPETMDSLFDAGLFSLTVPKECGGMGANTVEFTACMEEVCCLGPAYGITAVPHLCVSVSVVDRLAKEPLRSRILQSLRGERRLLSFAITEDTGSDLASMKTTVRKHASGRLLLNGRKQWVTNLHRATHVCVAALCPDLHPVPGAAVLILLPTSAPGLGFTRPWEKLVANGSDTCDLFLDEVEVDPDWFLGKPGDAFHHFNNLVLPGRLGAGSAAVGLASQSLTWAQANRILQIDELDGLSLLIDACRASLEWAACLVDENDHTSVQATAFAKLLACNAAQEVVDQIDCGCALQGQPSPHFLTRGRNALGLLRILKGPGEILGLQAVTSLAGIMRFANLPNENIPDPLRGALSDLLRTWTILESSSEGRCQPVFSALSEAMAGLQAILAMHLKGTIIPTLLLGRFQDAIARSRRLIDGGSEIFIRESYQFI